MSALCSPQCPLGVPVSTQHKYRPSYITRHLFHIQLRQSEARYEWDDSTWGTFKCHVSLIRSILQYFKLVCEWYIDHSMRGDDGWKLVSSRSYFLKTDVTPRFIQNYFFNDSSQNCKSLLFSSNPINKNDCLLGCDSIGWCLPQIRVNQFKYSTANKTRKT